MAQKLLFPLFLLSTFSCSFTKTSKLKVLPDTKKSRCICVEIYRPVCGSDGITYSNACNAECQPVSYKEGECL